MMTHGEIAEAVRRWLHIPCRRVAMKEMGLPDGKRIDVLSYEPYNKTLRLTECKATAVDLRRAPDQLEGYRRWADLLYLAVPEGLAAESRALTPKRMGLLVVGEPHPHWGSPVRCAKNPRRVSMGARERGAMTARVLTWLMAHFEATRKCRNCGHAAPHGPA